ncbi:ribosome small subunit-dependent GTPase A [Halalkalibacterium halodurans]|uniref:Small ribosomal subunit biogenesis GTPase RsgA n=1 Tax=Halalkalibacterium halodurans (strain ATCC BAA-125 / DSM 18197 / FERM 7344 / JCM 9153 / C-125) TaxID=272558 RepID=RSGA_HALH5|nr:ribosome small subunit-dependent GTPase A [Halalkalibacterium halodurans]Q9K9Z1.1 RecName: Full=Small ribosomal subunit biogenesis GTPase RsgA [Halalkalibacterium halodurans C-125]MED4081502.1 ribosome small subunit-dependent GTPase A [Halalkalibacterium halodurans]MED4086118.1 ribosome small subunit-dependent GTPase A [Halalkalibacterium halodurans]MED4106240.1 ribosome small subunit-dependent GTPase A [Halalkalibacterium halodurans]MED4108653.1 ribosome small subunit-dependent GTPase A [H
MPKGTIVKALSGFYYVQNEDGLFQCRGRGNFRNRNIKPLVGDEVVFEAENKTDGYVLEIMERKNELLRPPIANVDRAILVFSAAEPTFSPLLLDRFLVHVEANGIEPLIVISKIDLLTEEELETIKQYRNDYEQLGYKVYLTSTIEQLGLDAIRKEFDDHVSVIAGQSGVGKSSLLNAINPALDIETNQISSHLGRGKHTTRHVELIPFGSGLVADTPGFSSLDFIDMEPEELSHYFPEMRDRLPSCKFRGCTHTQEPKCAVKEALAQGEIREFRYEHYVTFLEEVKTQHKRRF